MGNHPQHPWIDFPVLAKPPRSVFRQGDHGIHPREQPSNPPLSPSSASLTTKPAVGREHAGASVRKESGIDAGEGEPLVVHEVGIAAMATEATHVSDVLDRL